MSKVYGGVCMYMWGAERLRDPKMLHWAAAAYIPLWTKEEGTGAGDFKRKAGNLYIDD